jgi:hypothetical protein
VNVRYLSADRLVKLINFLTATKTKYAFLYTS